MTTRTRSQQARLPEPLAFILFVLMLLIGVPVACAIPLACWWGWSVLVLHYGEPFLAALLAPLERLASSPSTPWFGAILATGMQGGFLFFVLWMLPIVLFILVVVWGSRLSDSRLRRRRRTGNASP